MRTVKFRGKRVDNGEWVYGNYCTWGKPIEYKLFQLEVGLRLDEYVFYEIIQTSIIEYGTVVGFSWERILPETVGQFTGLIDKKGKEIYEGDVVVSYGNVFKSVVKWVDCGWSPFAGERTSFFPDECKVIGNIHDNPELLESK